MSIVISTRIEKCKGAMLAAAIGDALGWPNEQRSKNRTKNPKVNDLFVGWTRSCNNPKYHDEKILPGEYSDDTQLILSVARSIIAGNWETFFAEKELPYWLKYERGGGSALRKAARSIDEKKVLLWRSNYTKDYFKAGGNGAAMRILPHVIAIARKPDIQTLMIDVIKNTLITHGHPRAFLGATCYAFALDYLLRKETVLGYGELASAVIDGQNIWGAFPNREIFGDWLSIANRYRCDDYRNEWNIVFSNMVRQLEFIKTSLKRGLMLDDNAVLSQLECFSKANGAGDVAALASIYLTSRYANNPALGIKVPAFSFGADTDTIASITGGLLGMLSGTNWIPIEWKIVQDYDCLNQITEVLYSENKKEAAKAETNRVKAKENGWEQSSIGCIRVVDTREVPNGKNGFVIITKSQTAFGQTIYTKEFQPVNKQPQSHIQDDVPVRLDTQHHSKLPEQRHQQTITQQTAIVEDKQQSITTHSCERQFILNVDIIKSLQENPAFKNNITVGKVFKVIQAFIEKDEPVERIARRFEINEAMVNLIKKCIKSVS